MASPPYSYSPTALSPPYPAPAQLPNKKRSADHSAGGAAGAGPQSIKRRKASTLSVASATSAAHPLRQTSFPPEGGLGGGSGAHSPFPRSPSADTMSHVSGSQVSGTAGTGTGAGGGAKAGGKKRGRKSKAETAAGLASKEQTPSLVGGRAPRSVASGAGGGAGGAGGAGDKDGAGAGEEEDEGDAPLDLVDSNARTQEQKQEESRLRGMLVLAMDKEQEQRFELWRAAKLPDAVVRRIVNATVSQSVPAHVVLAVRSVAKVFAGQLIESARQVQAELIERTGEPQAEVPDPPPQVDGEDGGGSGDGTAADGGEHRKGRKTGREGATVYGKGPRRGPLRPEHLREAFSRYARAGEGGGVGLQNLWHKQQEDGVERFGTRAGGRRLFK